MPLRGNLTGVDDLTRSKKQEIGANVGITELNKIITNYSLHMTFRDFYTRTKHHTHHSKAHPPPATDLGRALVLPCTRQCKRNPLPS